jgi:hypothetical protein
VTYTHSIRKLVSIPLSEAVGLVVRFDRESPLEETIKSVTVLDDGQLSVHLTGPDGAPSRRRQRRWNKETGQWETTHSADLTVWAVVWVEFDYVMWYTPKESITVGRVAHCPHTGEERYLSRTIPAGTVDYAEVWAYIRENETAKRM